MPIGHLAPDIGIRLLPMRHDGDMPALVPTLFDAWVDAAYGPGGFWPGSTPTAHFRTAATLGPELGDALVALLVRHPEIVRVVEVGAGEGLLLSSLAAAADRAGRPLQLAGIDLRSRPTRLPGGVTWVQDCWDVRHGRWSGEAARALLDDDDGPTLLVALEWLDDLPCRLAAGRADGRREVAADGVARGPLDPASARWAGTWWPSGHVVEVGLTRDVAWSSLVAGLHRTGGLALAVDYGHQRAARPPDGSLAGYRAGRRVTAEAEPGRNLTAHVAVDAVASAGRRAGATTLRLAHQRDVLDELLPATAASGPTAVPSTVADLAARSRRAALGSPRGWGEHWWLLQEVQRPRIAEGSGRPAVAT